MTSKIQTVNITKSQHAVFEYFKEIGLHNNISELVRQATFLQFYAFVGISTGVDDKVTLDVDINVWFKHVPKELARRLWNEKPDEGNYVGPLSVSMSPTQWDFIDTIVDTNHEDSRSSFLRRALTDFFKKELVMTETILRVKNGSKKITKNDETNKKPNKTKVDMRSISWKPSGMKKQQLTQE